MRFRLLPGIFATAAAAAFAAGLAVWPAPGADAAPALAIPPPQPMPNAEYGNLAPVFEPNLGQARPAVRYLVHASGYTAFLTSDGATFNLKSDGVIRLRFAGPGAGGATSPGDALPGTANYLIGSDPAQWRTGIPTYSSVSYQAIRPGVDLRLYGSGADIEADYVLAPNANPAAVSIGTESTPALKLQPDGSLAIGALEMKPPVIYQLIGNHRRLIEGAFALRSATEAGFQLGSYDHRRPLVIDPVLSYSTYLGGSGFDTGRAIALDSAHNAYVVGATASSDFPVGDQTSQHGQADVFVTKLNAAGSAALYSTYIGGQGDDFGNAITVDADGDAYITGSTTSADFPTVGPAQAHLAGRRNAFIAKLNPAGSGLLFSTYLGGQQLDSGNAIAIDGGRQVYVAGDTYSSDFPRNAGNQQMNLGDYGFVTKLNATGSTIVYSTLTGHADGFGIAVDGSGRAYVSGDFAWPDLPANGLIQSTQGMCAEGFELALAADGNSIPYLTYVGGTQGPPNVCVATHTRGIALDATGNTYVTGYTNAGSFPLSPSPVQATIRGGGVYGYDAYVLKLDPTLSTLLLGTYLGGSGDDYGQAVAIDGGGNAYVTGSTASADFPVADPLQSSLWGTRSAFVTEISASGSAAVYSTYLGGSGDDIGQSIAVDASGAYVTGRTSSTNLPTASPLHAANAGAFDAFVTRITIGTTAQPSHAGSRLAATFPLSFASGDDYSGKPTMASDGSKFLVVWHQSAAPAGIYAERISYDGRVIDPNGFKIAPDDGAHGPAVAFDGTNYVVVWISSAGTVFAVRVTPSAAVLDATPVQLSATGAAKLRMGTVAFDGTNYLTAWRDTSDQIRFLRFTPALATLDTNAGIALGHGYYPYVAYGGGKYLVVWHDGAGYCNCWIQAALVNTDGTVAKSAFSLTAAAPAGSSWPPPSGAWSDHSAAAFDGTNFLVIWHDYTGSGGSDTANGQTLGTRLTTAGSILDSPPLLIGEHTYGQSAPRLAFDGVNYMVVWNSNLDPGLYKTRESEAVGRRVTPAGALLDPHPVTLGGSGGHHWWPGIGYGGGHYLVVWTQGPEGPKGCFYPNDCLYGRVVAASTAPGPALSSAPMTNPGWHVDITQPWSDLQIRGLAGWSAADVYAVGSSAGYSYAISHRDSSGTWTSSWQSAGRPFGAWATYPHDLWTTDAGGEIQLLGDGLNPNPQKTGWLDSTGNQSSPGNGTAIWGTGRSGYMISAGTSGNLHHYDPALSVCPNNATNPGQGCIGFDAPAGQEAVDQNNWKTLGPDLAGTEWFGVWGASARDAFAVGELGAISHWDGFWWSPMPAPASLVSLNGVWGSSGSDVFTVGDGGVIEHYDGHTWSLQPTPTVEDLVALWGSGPSDVFAVGRSSTILHYDGTTWSQQTAPPAIGNVTLMALWGGSGLVFAAGEKGTVITLSDVTRPAAPFSVTATAGTQQAQLTWSAPDSGGSAITGYRVTPYKNGAAQPADTFNSTATAQTLTGLTPGATYTFTVAAINTVGVSTDSSPSNAVVIPNKAVFQPLTPFRLLDTRQCAPCGAPIGPYATPFGAGQTRTLQIAGAGSGTIPASGVTAVVLNVTATNTTQGGFFTIYPDGGSRPNVSNVNFAAGQTVPNLVQVAVGSDGMIDLYNYYGSADMIIDVAGYFATGGGASGLFNPLPPARVMDTRQCGPCGAPIGPFSTPFGSGQTRVLPIAGASLGGVPAGASGVVLNVTVTNPTNDGYLTLFPDGATKPNVSNVNFLAGQTVPNRVYVKLGSNGALDINNFYGSTDVIVDVNGYFSDGTKLTTGDQYYPLTPLRIIDTRQCAPCGAPIGPYGSPLGTGGIDRITVANTAGVPSTGAQAMVANVTATDTTQASFFTLNPDGTPRPNASDLNWIAGETVPNLAVTELSSDGKLDVYNYNGNADLIIDVNGYYAP